MAYIYRLNAQYYYIENKVMGLEIYMKGKYLMLVMVVMAMTVTPVFAGPGNGPKHPKYVASLEYMDVRYGQVIFNTNPEDDGLFELEVEVEECMDLADSVVTVKMNDQEIGTIEIDENGNGKETFYVEDPTGSTLTVEGGVTLTSGEWRDWIKGPGPK
jgi:hypothetical protein